MKKLLSILLIVALALGIPAASYAATAIFGVEEEDEMWYPTFLVWYDVNGDGTQGEGEMTLNNITVIAVDMATGQEVGQATGLMGSYYFNELSVGEYIFRIVLPDGMDYYTASVKNSFGSSLYAERTEKGVVEFEYKASPYEQTQFLIGVTALGDSYFSGYVWNDVDGDGVRPDFDGWSGGSNTEGENETGIEGAVVTAVNTQNSRATYTATTDNVGLYTFENLPAGEYTFTVEIPGQTNVTFTTPTGGAATVEVTEPDGQSVDFGVGKPQGGNQQGGNPNPQSGISFYGFVWIDADQNKLRPGYDDTNAASQYYEQGIEGATVTFKDQKGNVVATAVTQELGQYQVSVPSLTSATSASSTYIASVTLPDGYESYFYTTPVGGRIILTVEGEGQFEQNFGVASNGTSAPTATPTVTETATPGENPQPTPATVPGVTMTPSPDDPSGTPTEDPDGTPTEDPDGGKLVPGTGGTIVKLNAEEHYAYIVGYEDGYIRPENQITRQEVATIFFRLLTDESREAAKATDNSFSDVSAANWSNMAISTMANAGVLNGYEDGTFRPTNNITRAEFATIAAKFDSHAYVGPDKFSDISGHWANEYINRAAAMGWINGYEDGTFRPDAYITRAEAMTLVNNVLNRHVLPEGMTSDAIIWPDNPSDKWYYTNIEEATNSHYYLRVDGEKNETWSALRPNRDWTELEK